VVPGAVHRPVAEEPVDKHRVERPARSLVQIRGVDGRGVEGVDGAQVEVIQGMPVVQIAATVAAAGITAQVLPGSQWPGLRLVHADYLANREGKQALIIPQIRSGNIQLSGGRRWGEVGVGLSANFACHITYDL